MAFKTIFVVIIAISTPVPAAPRDTEWQQVRDAIDKRQPQTAANLLKPLEAAAFADHAWDEGTKALLMRVRMENGLWFEEDPFEREAKKPKPQTYRPPPAPVRDPFCATPRGGLGNQSGDPFGGTAAESGGDPAPDPFANAAAGGESGRSADSAAGDLLGCVRQLDREGSRLPEPVRAVLHLFQARWLDEYLWKHSGQVNSRSATATKLDEEMEAWDLPRFEAAIQHFRDEALAAQELTGRIPAHEWSALFRPGLLDDALRPTLHDLLAHAILEDLDESRERDDYQASNDSSPVRANSPAFDSAEAFLAWHPESPTAGPPVDPALSIYQNLLAFHRGDAARSAFLHCDLERLRWAGLAATGPNKEARHAAAIRAFIAANAAHPLSADARQDDAILWLRANRPVEAHATVQSGAAAFPEHPFGRMCADIARHFEEKSLDVAAPMAWPTGGDVVSIRQKNLGHLWFRLYVLDWEAAEAVVRTRPYLPQTIGDLAVWLDKRPARAWDLALAAPRDFRQHQEDLATPNNLPPGTYLFVVAGDEKFASKEQGLAWTWLTVADIGIVNDPSNSDDKHIAGRVIDVVSGNPLAGVKVEAWQHPRGSDTPLHWDALSGQDGGFRFEPQAEIDPARAHALVVAFSNNQRAFTWMATEPTTPARPIERSYTLFTDRAIYRPGQLIQFKGIATDADTANNRYATANGQKVEVALVGPNSKDCGKLDFTTNEFGSFSGSFPAPANSLLGLYSLRIGDRYEQRLRVEEYKRPKFTVELHRPDKPVTFGERLEVKGHALSYTEAPIDGATVEWSVHRNTNFSGWSGWQMQYGSELELMPFKDGKTTTAADGSFSVAFVAEADEAFDTALEPEASFYVSASVTDLTGEKHEVVICTKAGFVNLDATLELPEWSEADKPVDIRVHTKTLDGDPLPVAGILKVYQLKQPTACLRELEEVFNGRDDTLYDAPLPPPACWKSGEVLREMPVRTELAKDGKDCPASVSVSLPAGCYRVVFEPASAPHKAVAIADLQVEDPQAERFSTMLPFHVATPKSSWAPDEPYTLLWGSGLAVARACVEWLKDGKVLKREWSAPGRTQQVFSFMPDESMRGGICAEVTQCGANRLFQSEERFDMPWSDKELTLTWEHLTSKLEPGAKETWTAVIRGPDGKPVTAEMVATLYDASLDELVRHAFSTDSWRSKFQSNECRHLVFGSFESDTFSAMPESPGLVIEDPFRYDWCVLRRPYRTVLQGLGDSSALVGISFALEGRCWVRGQGRHNVWLDMRPYQFHEPPQLPSQTDTLMSAAQEQSTRSNGTPRDEAFRRVLDSIRARRDLRETAFFYPHLTSGADGAVRISFVMPEGLGRWRFLGFAHDAAMRFGSLEGETVTAKSLMVQPNPPRFLREGDVLDIPVRLFNQSEREQAGLARFTVSDAAGEHDLTQSSGITAAEQAFQIPAQQAQTLMWRLTVPEGSGPLRYKAVATSGSLSDGEEGWLPVLPRRILVTDSLALRMRDAGEKHVEFAALRDSGKSDTLRNQSLQVEVVSQPAWLALLALPSLIEFPHECAEQTFHRYYADAIAAHLVRSDPRIRKVLDAWRDTPALDSPLARNQQRVDLRLEETPWLQAANNETRQRQHLAHLFDDVHLASQQTELQQRLESLQGGDGLWPWFAGGQGSEAITLCIATGYGRLRAMGVETDIWPAVRAVSALDARLTMTLRAIRRRAEKEPGWLDIDHLDPVVARQLYARSFFLKDKELGPADQEARAYFLQQARQYWPKLGSRMAEAFVALALWRDGDAATARLITRSLRERALRNAEDGMCWRDAFADGWWWWQAPVETQAMMIEVLSEIDQDPQAVDDCRTWLLQQKRAGAWPTTIATADAVHALLTGGRDLLGSDVPLRISLGGTAVDPGGVAANAGFYQHSFAAGEVKPEMADVVLSKRDPGVAWASVSWQYLEDMAKITGHNATPLKLEKALFVRHDTPQGPKLEPVSGPVKVGDELVTRLVLRNDRAMEFVHLKDGRGSGTEPLNVLSGYRWQDGLGYYEETRDTASHFFIDTLPAGTHVFETSVRVQHAGIYQTGIAEIQCMYAPEFSAHSASVRLEVVR